MFRFLRKLFTYTLGMISGFVLGSVLLYLHLATSGPQPQRWHETLLDQEYRAGMATEVPDFDAYLALEERLFGQLQHEIYDPVGSEPRHLVNRFSRGSLSDPHVHGAQWNRSFELPVEAPRGGVLMLHGMSDSPYAMKHLGESLHAQGFWVVGLRLPGHGTAPSGLLHFTWEDMAAAVRLAAAGLAARIGDRPLLLVGYSNGAALCLDYTLDALTDDALRRPSGLVLLSPAVGLPPVAALASLQSRLSFIPGMERLAWTDILPEFDPYKYNSFTVNAGEQVYRITESINSRMARLSDSKALEAFPPVLAFLSTVDATVSARSVIDRLLRVLGNGQNELVLFDINRRTEAASLLKSDPASLSSALAGDSSLPFALSLLSNADPGSRQVVEHFKQPRSDHFEIRDTGLEWPQGVFSLSHVALPFPPSDPLYGDRDPGDPERIYLGKIELQGERGVLVLPADWLLRLRHNPFYGFLQQRTLQWLKVVAPAADPPGEDPPPGH